MVAVDLKSLVGRLNDQCRRSLEAAAGLTLSRSNFNVEIEHWLMKLLEAPNTDLPIILAGGGYKHGAFREVTKESKSKVPLCNLFVDIAQKMGGNPVQIWEDREYWGEANAMLFLRDRVAKEKFHCRLFGKIKRAVEEYAKDYEARFAEIAKE